MNPRILHMITAYILSLIHNPGNGCHYGMENKLFSANCKGLGITQFSSLQLPKTIEILILSHNSVQNLSNDSLFEYSSIKHLYLDHNAVELESHVFTHLTKLITLDLSFNPRLNLSQIHFPASIRKLYLNGLSTLKIEHLPLNSHHQLSYLELSSCSLEQIPSFDGDLPQLQTLNLSCNPLRNLKIENFAPLCNLKMLFFSKSAAIADQCECAKIEKWANERNIMGNYFFCDESFSSVQQCNLTLPYNLTKICVFRAPKGFIYWFILAFVILVVFIFGGCILYKFKMVHEHFDEA